jgi:hypothetical protein
MKLTAREMTLGVATLAVVLGAGTWMWAEPRIAALEDLRDRKRENRLVIERSEQLLAREEQWRGRLERLREKLPSYGADERVATTLMQSLREKAGAAGLTLLRDTPQNERRVGELYEVSIVYQWEGSLESLVRFLYKLQSESVNLDVGSLSARPASGRDGERQLKGAFTVDVAYTRDADAAEAEVASPMAADGDSITRGSE